ncbi:MAG: NAD(P)H-hydrate epimerase [Conexivisphaerales archaeon]
MSFSGVTITSKQMQEIEKNAESIGFSKLLMMENAGRAVADIVYELYDPILNPTILAVCGPGNNGGDCITAARHLSPRVKVVSILVGEEEKIRTDEARQQWEIARNSRMNIRIAPTKDALVSNSGQFFNADIILDGLFGTGVRSPIGEPFRTAINLINQSTALKISIDLPSGMDPDTGESSDVVVNPDLTIVLHAMKRGLLKQQAKCGLMMVAPIGISLKY